MSPLTDTQPYDPSLTGDHLICTACGTQFPTADRQQVRTCFICDDPRQFTPPSGQSFTTLNALRATTTTGDNHQYQRQHRNIFTPLPGDEERFISIHTTPKVAIGQRAILIRTTPGTKKKEKKNVLWDCVTLIDDETIARVRELGGLDAIVISHPHYYSTHLEWARAFSCPVYLAAEDKAWLTTQSSSSSSSSPLRRFITETEFDVPVNSDDDDGSAKPSGVKVLKLGGHFPGSMVALYDGRLLVADTLVTTPAGLGSWETDALGAARADGDGRREDGSGRPAGMNSFSFMWSIPNMIPLAPGELARMWGILGRHAFRSTHGAFVGVDIFGGGKQKKKKGAEKEEEEKEGEGEGKEEAVREMRTRVLESMQIQIRYMGYGDHALLQEKVEV
ncbi:beta-lactamase-like protein [Xylariomycetidae sp. FL2044]|nr:beta-lactamase-like protein [Xylariomycetidae sp. FL2044]